MNNMQSKKPFIKPTRDWSIPRKQTGVALFISLILLLILTIIGVSSVQTTSLEVRMSRNSYDSLLAFQAAEAALRDAQQTIEGWNANLVDEAVSRFRKVV